MKRVHDPDTSSEDDSSSETTPIKAHLHPEVRTCIAKIGKKLSTFQFSQTNYLKVLSETGYGITKKTLNTWMDNVEATGSAVSIGSGGNRPSLLSREKKEILYGYVLHQNGIGKLVTLRSIISFISQEFGISVSDWTARQYMREGSFSQRLVKSRGTTYSVDTNILSETVLNWFQLAMKDMFFPCPPSQLCSIDFTYTGHRTERRRSFTPISAGKPGITDEPSSYTNCIITLVFADGKQRCPPVLFTYNPQFRKDKLNTARRRALAERLEGLQQQYGVEDSQLVFLSNEGSAQSFYVAERSDLVHKFFEIYAVGKNWKILSDKGRAFFPKGESVLKELGFSSHLTYPPEVHHYLSPNDNHLHGSAKSKWRSMALEYKDDVHSSLALLNCLQTTSPRDIKDWFNNNLLQSKLSQREKITIGECKKIVCGDGETPSNYYIDSLFAYRIHAGLDARGGVPNAPKGLENLLDGRAWQIK